MPAFTHHYNLHINSDFALEGRLGLSYGAVIKATTPNAKRYKINFKNQG